MNNLSSAAQNINWLIGNFVGQVPGVKEAVVVSADGLPMAVSEGLDRDAADRFAAVASGLIGLAYGAAGRFGGGAVNRDHHRDGARLPLRRRASATARAWP